MPALEYLYTLNIWFIWRHKAAKDQTTRIEIVIEDREKEKRNEIGVRGEGT